MGIYESTAVYLRKYYQDMSRKRVAEKSRFEEQLGKYLISLICINVIFFCHGIIGCFKSRWRSHKVDGVSKGCTKEKILSFLNYRSQPTVWGISPRGNCVSFDFTYLVVRHSLFPWKGRFCFK